ncbi:MAG: hypothetical protein QM680_14625 [Luteolibacter sp.]
MKLLFREDRGSDAFCHYQIDSERRLQTEVYEGRIGLEEMRSLAKCVVSDPKRSVEYHHLIDLRAADLKMTSNDVLRLALMLRQDVHYSKGWRVYVVTTTTAFGVVRMLTRWARTSERSLIFRTKAEAEAWLASKVIEESEREVGDEAAIAPLRKIG